MRTEVGGFSPCSTRDPILAGQNLLLWTFPMTSRPSKVKPAPRPTLFERWFLGLSVFRAAVWGVGDCDPHPPEDIWQHLVTFLFVTSWGEGGRAPGMGGWRPERLLNTLWCTRSPSQQIINYLSLSIKSAKVEDFPGGPVAKILHSWSLVRKLDPTDHI